MTIGEKIKICREKYGLTQAQLGEKIGVKGATITRYEKNQREPGYQNLRRIAASLKVPFSELIGANVDCSIELIDALVEHHPKCDGLNEKTLETIQEESGIEYNKLYDVVSLAKELSQEDQDKLFAILAKYNHEDYDYLQKIFRRQKFFDTVTPIIESDIKTLLEKYLINSLEFYNIKLNEADIHTLSSEIMNTIQEKLLAIRFKESQNRKKEGV